MDETATGQLADDYPRCAEQQRINTHASSSLLQGADFIEDSLAKNDASSTRSRESGVFAPSCWSSQTTESGYTTTRPQNPW